MADKDDTLGVFKNFELYLEETMHGQCIAHIIIDHSEIIMADNVPSPKDERSLSAIMNE